MRISEDKELFVDGEHACDLLIVSMIIHISISISVSMSLSLSLSLYRTEICEDGEHACDLRRCMSTSPVPSKDSWPEDFLKTRGKSLLNTPFPCTVGLMFISSKLPKSILRV
jgi:hypothetical protein